MYYFNFFTHLDLLTPLPMTFVKNKTELLEPPYPKDEMGIFLFCVEIFFHILIYHNHRFVEFE